MAFNPRRAWFRPKRIGWGWSPNSWEGWALTLGLVLAIVALVRMHLLGG